jgi:uncharacterized protein (DUF488 family)
VQVYTLGFTQRTAEDFFGALRQAGVRRVLDVRIGNTSQLSAFTKRDDLLFFLRELCGAEYVHEPLLAPTRDMRDAFKRDGGSWAEYERRFLDLLEQRMVEERLDPELFAGPTALLCSERTAQHCHRRLVLEYLQQRWKAVPLEIVHL